MSLLKANLSALKETGSDLPERLKEPSSTAHLERKEDGALMLRIHRTRVGLSLRDATVDLVLSEFLTPPDEVLIFGLGLGEILEDVLLRGSETRIRAWERDPALLIATLSQVDCADAIRSGRLELLLGADLVAHCGKDTGTILVHPLLSQIYWRELAFLQGDTARPRALVASGTLFVDDVSHGLIQEGYATWTLDLQMHSTREMVRTMQKLAPQVIVAINYTLGLAELCAEQGIPLWIWEIDPAIERIKSPEGEVGQTHIFTWSRSNAREWRRVGFEQVRYLPLAANPEHRKPLTLSRAEKGRYEADVCFVGSSLLGQVVDFRSQLRDAVGEWLRRHGKEPEHAATIIDAILMHQRMELNRYVVPELVEGAMPGFLAEMKALKKRFDPIMLLGELAAAERRLSVVASMGEMGIHVWGDAGWRNLRKHGVRFRASAGHKEELTRIYNAASIHIDIGRIYQLDIVTMRVFDVISCGGFVIAERNSALLELFKDGEEIETWVNVEQLKTKCRYYLEHPDEAAEIARKGRERLLKAHTIQARLQRMLELSGGLS